MQKIQDLCFQVIPEHVPDFGEINSKEDLEITLPGGFTGTTYIVKNIRQPVSEHNPVIFKEYDKSKRAGLEKEMKFVQILSEQGWGPKVYYVCDTFRIEQYLDARPMGIFEMRNPHYVEQILIKMIEYNNNADLHEALSSCTGVQKKSLLQDFLDTDYPIFKNKIQKLKAREDSKLNETELQAVEQWVDQGIDKLLIKLLGSFESEKDMVVSHNDAQQGNVLVFNKDQAKVMIIDYEDTTFGPRYQDLGSYFGCFMKDNAHPEAPGIKFYPENTITEQELRYYIDFYLGTYYDKLLIESTQQSSEDYIEANKQQLYEDTVCGMLFFHYYYGVWAINQTPLNFQQGIILCSLLCLCLRLKLTKDYHTFIIFRNFLNYYLF